MTQDSLLHLRRLSIVGGITLAALLPFVGKPFQVDDPLFLRAARQIQEHPLDPYGFRYNMYQYEQPFYTITKNPPLSCYLLALCARLVGWNEVGLHLCYLLPALAAATGTYFLARRFCNLPAEATLLAVATPAFLVSATSVMCDTLMLALWCWAIEFWFRGLDSRRAAYFLTSSVLIACAALTKYFAVSLIPLLALITLARRRWFDECLFWLLVPLAFLGAYEVYTIHLYRIGLLGDAMRFGRQMRAQFSLHVSATNQVITALAYPGGCFVTILFLAPMAWSKWEWLGFAAILVLAVLSFLRLGSYDDIPLVSDGQIAWSPFCHLVLYWSAGLCALMLGLVDWWRRRDVGSLFLNLWLFGTWYFTVMVNWTVNARSFLPAAPALGILLMRQFDYWQQGAPSGPKAAPAGRFRWAAGLALAASFAVSMSVAWAEYSDAWIQREAVRRIVEEHRSTPAPLWFWTHRGFQYYMEAAGARPWSPMTSEVAPGEWLAYQVFEGDNSIAKMVDRSDVVLSFDLPLPCRLSPTSYRTANFYGFAGFPFALFPSSSEAFRVITPRVQEGKASNK